MYLNFVQDRNVCARGKHCLMPTNRDIVAVLSLVQYEHVADWFMIMT